jgi:membrane protease YdiL (CAAX protease family)
VQFHGWLPGPPALGHHGAVRAVTEALALKRSPGLYRDPHFLLALGGGLVFWGLLAAVAGVRTPGPGGLLSWPYLYLGVVAPVLEELAFRGALQGWLLDTHYGRHRAFGVTAANATASAAFTAIHFAYHPPAWAAAVLVPSLVFGHLRDRTGSVVPAILVHVFYNLGYFALTGLPTGPGG